MMNARMVAMAVVSAFALTAAAQEPAPAPGQGPTPEMQSLFRQRLGEFVKRQLGLTDEQYQKLQTVDQKYASQRFTLMQQEREIRITIRDEVLRGDSADQKRVARLLDEMMKVQSTRLQILQNEQKELAGFLTPVQRAKYLGIQEQIKKRLQAMKEGRGQGAMGARGQGMKRMPPPPADQGAPPADR